MSATAHTEVAAILFKNEKDGGLTVVVQGREIEYQGAYDREKVVAAVRRLELRQKDRASLYLDASDRCQVDEVSDELYDLGQACAERAGRVDSLRQRFGIPLTPIGNVNNDANNLEAEGGNDGLPTVPPSTVDTFVPRLPMSVTKEMREHMVRALEGVFVPYYRGEMALRALGLESGEMSCYVNWLAPLSQLSALTLFMLGRATITLKEEQVVNDCCLPAGSYGNGEKIVMARGGGERHWQVVTTLFRDSRGGLLNSATLRTLGAKVAKEAKEDGAEYRNIIYLFYPLIFDSDGRPRQNGLFVGQEVGRVGLVGLV